MNNKKIIIIILALLVVVWLVVTGYFLYKFLYSDSLKISSTLFTAPRHVINPPIILTSDEPVVIKSVGEKPIELIDRVEPIVVQEPILTEKKAIVSTSPAISKTVIKFIVPFAAQAPFGEWSDPKQQNACEEISAVMTIAWAKGETLTLKEAKDRVIAISDWEQETYGSYQDTSTIDTVKRIFKEYFDYQKVEVFDNVTMSDIIKELESGNLVAVPTNGKLLHNPFFTAPGPATHMLVISGYDYRAKEFITNDPGTRQGEDYRYKQEILFEAIRDYPTGYHEPIKGIQKNMIVVKK